MIIFDLDGTLADCEHRRHFVDPEKSGLIWGGVEGEYKGNWTKNGIGIKWKPDWKLFYEACDKDLPIQSVCKIFDDLAVDNDIQIWSGRCESVRDKTIKWLYENMPYSGQILKMRPKGDNTPDDQLKERWLNERCADLISSTIEGKPYPIKHDIEFVFDDRPKVVRMWRRRGIFVFDCNQDGKEF